MISDAGNPEKALVKEPDDNEIGDTGTAAESMYDRSSGTAHVPAKKTGKVNLADQQPNPDR
jgi:hypothetical protein